MLLKFSDTPTSDTLMYVRSSDNTKRVGTLRRMVGGSWVFIPIARKITAGELAEITNELIRLNS